MPIARQVMILTKDGLLLLHYKFRGAETLAMETDPDLFSGMLSAILSIAKETRGGLVKTINQDNYNVLVSEGEKIYVLLFIDEESRELNNIAKAMVGRFEAKFKKGLDGIITDVTIYQQFIEELEEIYAEIFRVDAELLAKLIPEVTQIKNVSIFEKPMNHQVYTGPRDPFVSEYEQEFQEIALKIIESFAIFSEKTLEFHRRTIITFKNRVIVLEDLGTHVLMFIGVNVLDILAKIKRIRKRAGLPSERK